MKTHAVFREPTSVPIWSPQHLRIEQADGVLAPPSVLRGLQPWIPSGVQRPARELLPVDRQSPSGHDCPKTWKVRRLNLSSEYAEMSFLLPSIVSFLFACRHRACR